MIRAALLFWDGTNICTVRNAFRGCFLIMQASRVISKTRATFKPVLTGGYLMLTARGTSKTEKLSIEEILRFLVWLLRKLFTLVWVMFLFTKQTCFGIFLLTLLLGTWWGFSFSPCPWIVTFLLGSDTWVPKETASSPLGERLNGPLDLTNSLVLDSSSSSGMFPSLRTLSQMKQTQRKYKTYL